MIQGSPGWHTFPIQKLPMAQKDDEWGQQTVDALIGREAGFSERHSEMKVAYDMYNSVFDERDFKYVVQPYNVKDGFPATLQNINIIRPKIDLLLGEETKRPDSVRVYQTNEEAVDTAMDVKKQLLMSVLESTMAEQKDLNDPDALNQFKKALAETQSYISSGYYNPAEKTAYDTLRYLKEKLNLKDTFLRGWQDALLAGEEVYYCGMIGGEPLFERVNPIAFSYDRDPDLKNIEDGDWAVRRLRMSPAGVYDRFYDLMNEEQLDQLLEEANGAAGTTTSLRNSGSTINTNYIVYKDLSSFISNDIAEDTQDVLLDVYHVVWKSLKKVGFLTELDENGEQNTTIVDENYKADAGEQIEWDWINEVWEGYKVGTNLYVGIGPISYQGVSIDNPNSCKLPYVGAVYSMNNSPNKSLAMIMKPLQYFYMIIFYRMELAIARDKGKVLLMDMTQIPKSQGIDPMQWMHYLSSMGIAFINPYEEGFDIPGREGGRASAFNQFQQYDLTMGNVIGQYIELLNKIEEMLGELSGVSKQRQGTISSNELVGNVERSVIQSSHITEPLFWRHSVIKRNALTALLNATQHAWRYSGKQKLSYVLDGPERIFLNVTEDFLYSDFDVFVSDSTEEHRSIEALRTLVQPAMQNGASLLDMASLLTTNNMSEIKQKLEKIENARKEAEQSAAEAQNQQAETNLKLISEELRIKEEDSIRKSETALQIAMLSSDSKEVSESAKQLLQEREFSDTSTLGRRKQDEVERSNRAKEEIARMAKRNTNTK